jgi:hypothetical protein
MSSALYLQQVRSSPLSHNPYFEFFRDSVGKGDNLYYSGIGDIYSAVPEFQRGYGILTRQSASATRSQLGYGFGSWLSNIFRFAKPLLKRGLKDVAQPLMSRGIQEMADVAGKIASDTLQGAKFSDSMRKRTTEKAQELIEKAPGAFSGLIRKSKGNGIKSRSSQSRLKGGRRERRLLLVHQPSKSEKKRKKVEFSYPGLKLIK